MATARDLPHPEPEDLRLTQVLFALSDPARLSIVQGLVHGPQEVAACQPAGGDLPKSTLSHHIKTLREAGVIRSTPHGRQRLLELRRGDLDARFPGLLTAVLTTPDAATPDAAAPDAAAPGDVAP
ncbi:winged helix-turn-helix domain-containing protein [Kitasatospora paranensis]|uniref:ArsR/SmtB family transcription factor n=1 Tax=Kitasatospora paranensis TaxID=258053 RepID=A0ABW2FWH3_9ACTN